MAEQTILCPKCGTSIPLTEAFTQGIEEKLRARFDADLKKKAQEHENALRAKEREAQELLAQERSRLEAQARQRAKEAAAVELDDLKSQLAEKAKQVDEARRQEIDLRKRQRELEERERSMRLETERTLDAERKRIREEAEAKAAEEHHFREMEKEKQLADMRKQIEDLKRKSELTSQQVQGEVQELALQELLSSLYPVDAVEEVGKGVRGADVVQRVRNRTGADCGTILYESKRTKHFGNDWIGKLKADALQAKADLCVIVTEALPEGFDGIGQMDGVWICRFSEVKGLSLLLRESLVQVHGVSTAQSNKGEKMQMLYDYLTGNEFRMQLEAILEGFRDLQESYQDEKLRMQKIWKEREKQLEKVLLNTVNFYGSIKGIAGSSIPEIKMLDGGGTPSSS